MDICSILEKLLNLKWFPTFWKYVFILGMVAICKVITIECDRMFMAGSDCAFHAFVGIWWVWILTKFVELNGFFTKIYFLRDYLALEEYQKRKKDENPDQENGKDTGSEQQVMT